MRFSNSYQEHKRDRVYDAPRFTIGGNTRELIIPLGRTFETGFSTDQLSIELFIKRRTCSPVETFMWTPYAITKGKAHFEIPDELMQNPTDFPRGMYDVSVKVAGCTVASLEMIKAPSFFVRGVETRDSKSDCPSDSPWVEPPCEEPTVEEKHIKAACPVDEVEGCPKCLTDYHVAEVTLRNGYGF